MKYLMAFIVALFFTQINLCFAQDNGTTSKQNGNTTSTSNTGGDTKRTLSSKDGGKPVKEYKDRGSDTNGVKPKI
jgi:hypothetical protein